MSDAVLVQKVSLGENEELQSFIGKVVKAVQEKSETLFLKGIYKGYIIAKCSKTNKLFKMSMGRSKEGVVKLGEGIEVKSAFIPVAKGDVKKVTGKTGESNGHVHSFEHDEGGNGSTDEVNGHSHSIQNFRIMPAGGHSHELPQEGMPDEEMADKGKKKDKEKAEKSEKTLIAVNGEVRQVNITSEELLDVIDEINSDEPELVSIKKESLWTGILS